MIIYWKRKLANIVLMYPSDIFT